MERHLRGLELVKDICNGKMKGGHLGSTEVEFIPGQLRGGKYTGQVRTAGSISLLLQVALPCALFTDSDVHLTLHGGTNADMTPQIDYMTEVFRPVLNKFGATFDFDLVRRGYFPKGGGEAIINIRPVSKLNAVNLVDQGAIVAIYGWNYVAGVLPISMANRLANGAIEKLQHLFKKVEIERYKEDKNIGPDNYAGIVLVAEISTRCYRGGGAFGNRNTLTEESGRRTGQEIVEANEAGACVDKHCQDQIIIFMALAEGESRVRVREVILHTKTAIFVAEHLTPAKFYLFFQTSISK